MSSRSYQTQQVSETVLLNVLATILVKSFHDCPRVEAKQRFRALEEGKRIFLTKWQMEDGTSVDVTMRLDRSELRGPLNFSLLRKLTGVLVTNFATILKEEKPVRTLATEDGTQTMFMPPAIGMQAGHLNAMGAAVHTGYPGELVVDLQFLDPDQFRQQEAVAS